MLKDFYKPNKQKVIIAIIIMIIHICIAFYSANTILCTENCPTPNIIQKITYPTVYPFIVVWFIGEFFEDFHFLPESLMITFTMTISLFIFGLLWYSLSCGIVKIKSKYYSK